MTCPHEKVYRNVCVDCLTNKTGKAASDWFADRPLVLRPK